MTDYNQFHDSINVPPPPVKKIPDMINVLTILTFIWSAYEFLSGIAGYFMACKQTMPDGGENLSKTPFGGLFSSLQETLVRSCEMKVPLLIVHLLTPVICVIGAIMMRKLKKSGFFLYLLGELVGPAVAVALLGGGIIMIVGHFFFPLVFVILYATQVKHMK
jgi:hypothetical protein